MKRLVPLAILLLLVACSRPEPEGPAALPSQPPYLHGAITAMDDAGIRVEADPGAASGSDKAMLRLTPGTRILWRTGEVADRGDLRLGTVVSAWVTGPVAESYPVQATAATIVIESTTRPAAPQA
jgi:hypothetical protein